MNELKQRFLDLSPRDQLMLVLGGLALLTYILVFVVLLPMQRDLERMDTRNRQALDEQQNVRQLAGQVLATQQTGGQAGPADGSLNGILNESLRQHGLRMENFQPSGNSARVRLAPSEFNRVLAWLHDMEVRQGLNIRDLTIGADQHPGAVLVSLQLQQGE